MQEGRFSFIKNITIYTADNCAYCVQLKKLLKRWGKKFTEVNITNDYDKRQWLVNLTGMTTVPVLVVGDRHSVGLNLPRIRELVG